LEHRAKLSGDAPSITALSEACAEAIQSLPCYRDAPFVAAVPPMSAKPFDLPTEIAARVSILVAKQNLTSFFVLEHEKQASLKQAPLEEKWAILEATGLRLNRPISNKSDVILIDDKYQSGTTVQFVAMKLQEVGARYIFGISLVKTLRDTDNASY
jgi:predicted amidophosphoribosyltransferase